MFFINMHLSKQLLSLFVDFIILVLVFSLIVGFIFILKLLLYTDREPCNDITLLTESLPLRYENALKEGDSVYDTLTKREIGKIKSLKRTYDEDRVKFLIGIDAKFKPRSESVRTKRLWFNYRLIEEKEN